MRGTMRQNVQKTIPIYLQPPYKNGPLFTSPKIQERPVRIFLLLPPVPAPAWQAYSWWEVNSRLELG